MKRRDFMSWVGVGFLASSLPMALAACTPQDSPEKAEPTAKTPASADGFAPLGSVADLDTKGALVDKGFAAGPVIAIRDPANADNVIALDLRCPHQGCSVEWQAKEAAFACPCHSSKFAPDGSVTNGPATTALKNYNAKIEDEQVLVKAT
ncbi:MAG: ubiquinol-cytochrome c reductase iron-sulfur subunit [Coleofasciculaceae cyanobacterium]